MQIFSLSSHGGCGFILQWGRECYNSSDQNCPLTAYWSTGGQLLVETFAFYLHLLEVSDLGERSVPLHLLSASTRGHGSYHWQGNSQYFWWRSCWVLLMRKRERERELTTYFLFAQKSTQPLHHESPSYTPLLQILLIHHCAVTFAIHLPMITFLYNWRHPLKLLHLMQKSWHILTAVVPFQMELPLVFGVLFGGEVCVYVCDCGKWLCENFSTNQQMLFLVKEQHFLTAISFVLQLWTENSPIPWWGEVIMWLISGLCVYWWWSAGSMLTMVGSHIGGVWQRSCWWWLPGSVPVVGCSQMQTCYWGHFVFDGC